MTSLAGPVGRKIPAGWMLEAGRIDDATFDGSMNDGVDQADPGDAVGAIGKPCGDHLPGGLAIQAQLRADEQVKAVEVASVVAKALI